MRIVSIQSIASMFSVSHQTIANWQEQGLPVVLRGGPGVPSEYESADCIRWFVDREMRSAQAETPNNRLARAKAEAQELNNAQRRGLLIPADMLEPKLKAAFVAARTMWLDAVPRLARELPANQDAREAMLQGEFEAFLRTLANWGKADTIVEDEE